MTDFNDNHSDPHAPSAEFRSSLEREIGRAYRSELLFDPEPAGQTRRLGMMIGLVMGAVVTLTVGLVLGASTGYASAEALSAKQRAATATTMATTRQLARTRVDLARSRLALVRQSVEAGTATQATLVSAQAQVDSAELSVALIESDLNANRDATPPPRPAFAMIPRSALTALTCATVASSPAVAQGIPVVTLPPAAAKTTETVGAVWGLRQIEGGKLLVDDGSKRQVKLFDSTLSVSTVVVDSTPGGSNSYGPRPVALRPYLADSSLFPDLAAKTMLVIDPRGQVARALAMTSPGDVGIASSSVGGVDPKGRVFFTGLRTGRMTEERRYVMGDSLPILRADLDLRRVDTIGRIANPIAKASAPTLAPNGVKYTLFATDPLKVIDDWAVLADGSVAIVRGQDYHIDFIRPDGTTMSTPKLPFDWRKLTDEDKQRIADSTRISQNAALANGFVRGEMVEMIRSGRGGPPPDGAAPGGRGRGGSGGGRGSDDGSGLEMDGKGYLPRPAEVVAPSQMPDFFPPIRIGTTMADRDGNLWILPTTSKYSQNGELVYDVINTKGELFQRVRIPFGRLIVGFGKGGVVYMTSGDMGTGFHIERSTLPRAAKPASK